MRGCTTNAPARITGATGGERRRAIRKCGLPIGLLAALGGHFSDDGMLVAAGDVLPVGAPCEALAPRAALARALAVAPSPRAAPAASRRDGWVGGSLHTAKGAAWCSRTTRNVTPEEDYRTALLSDSPDAGCSLGGW